MQTAIAILVVLAAVTYMAWTWMPASLRAALRPRAYAAGGPAPVAAAKPVCAACGTCGACDRGTAR